MPKEKDHGGAGEFVLSLSPSKWKNSFGLSPGLIPYFPLLCAKGNAFKEINI
jgi:hypothetical protein